MKKAQASGKPTQDADELLPEYNFDYRKARPNRPTDKNCQFISRRLNIIEAQTKHKHSINSDPNFICRRHAKDLQEQVWGEQ